MGSNNANQFYHAVKSNMPKGSVVYLNPSLAQPSTLAILGHEGIEQETPLTVLGAFVAKSEASKDASIRNDGAPMTVVEYRDKNARAVSKPIPSSQLVYYGPSISEQ